MALDQSALLDLPGELKLTDATERIRVETETFYQELTDAEATAFIGAAPFFPALLAAHPWRQLNRRFPSRVALAAVIASGDG
jgi:hypothetical protein